METRARRLTRGGAPACEPGGVGESDHSDSSCLVSSSTLAAAVSSSICFRSMCFMARAGQEGVAMRTETFRLGPALAPGPRPASPAPYQLTLEIKVQYVPSAPECLAVHGAGRCGAPAFWGRAGSFSDSVPRSPPTGNLGPQGAGQHSFTLLVPTTGSAVALRFRGWKMPTPSKTVLEDSGQFPLFTQLLVHLS